MSLLGIAVVVLSRESRHADEVIENGSTAVAVEDLEGNAS